jgi:hypothetical protein
MFHEQTHDYYELVKHVQWTDSWLLRVSKACSMNRLMITRVSKACSMNRLMITSSYHVPWTDSWLLRVFQVSYISELKITRQHCIVCLIGCYIVNLQSGDNCIAFENFTASIRDLMDANWDNWRRVSGASKRIFATIKIKFDATLIPQTHMWMVGHLPGLVQEFQ